MVIDEDGETISSESNIVYDYNCGGMFRAAINRRGKAVCRIWKHGQYDRVEAYDGEGMEYDVQKWLDEKS